MTFPAYKKILVNSAQANHIFTQFDQLDFGQFPYILELKHLADDQEDVINILEKYFEEHDLSTLAYPIVILTDCKINHPLFYITNDIKKIPQFFKFKNKQLSSKEEQKLNFVSLKQTHLANIALEPQQVILRTYAQKHKDIYAQDKKNQFLKLIIEHLG